jgi:hypothetical protein
MIHWSCLCFLPHCSVSNMSPTGNVFGVDGKKGALVEGEAATEDRGQRTDNLTSGI